MFVKWCVGHLPQRRWLRRLRRIVLWLICGFPVVSLARSTLSHDFWRPNQSLHFSSWVHFCFVAVANRQIAIDMQKWTFDYHENDHNQCNHRYMGIGKEKISPNTHTIHAKSQNVKHIQFQPYFVSLFRLWITFHRREMLLRIGKKQIGATQRCRGSKMLCWQTVSTVNKL